MLWYHQLLSPFMEYWYSHWINRIIEKIYASIFLNYSISQQLSKYFYEDWVKLKSFRGLPKKPFDSYWIKVIGFLLKQIACYGARWFRTLTYAPFCLFLTLHFYHWLICDRKLTTVKSFNLHWILWFHDNECDPGHLNLWILKL